MSIPDIIANLEPWQTVAILAAALWGFGEILWRIAHKMLSFLQWLFRRIWNGREAWTATCTYLVRDLLPDSDPYRAFSGNRKIRWSTMTPQKEDDFYTLDIGKERKIHSMEFVSGVSLFNYPAKYQLLTLNDEQKIVHSVISNGPIKCDLQPAQKIRIVHVTILEPQKMKNGNSYHWSIHDIKLRECRLWGLWKAVI